MGALQCGVLFNHINIEPFQVEKSPTGGRVLTKTGRKDLDRLAGALKLKEPIGGKIF